MYKELFTGALALTCVLPTAATMGCSSDRPSQEPRVLGDSGIGGSSGGGGSGGSSGTRPPAQGAVVEMIQPAPGTASGCTAVSPPFFAPPNSDPVSGTMQSLNCDLTVPGCKPNANVVVDGANAIVDCSVVEGSDVFDVSATLKPNDLLFNIRGTLSPTGGKAFVASSHSGQNLQDPSCDVTIEPNKGQIIPGAIWGAFNCSAFGEPSSAAGPGCTATGKFIFENCGK